jgi:hypothetical protein
MMTLLSNAMSAISPERQPVDQRWHADRVVAIAGQENKEAAPRSERAAGHFCRGASCRRIVA